MARERKGRGDERGIMVALDALPIQPPDPFRLFGNTNPLQIDLGCGKGRFLLARASANPDVNFIGVDRLMRRLTKLNVRAIDRGLTNIWLIQADGLDALTHLLPAASVAACFIFFPDPWPKRRHHHRRLFSPEFMDALARALTPGGELHAATDDHNYFAAIAAIIGGDKRFEPTAPLVPSAPEKTEFELIAERNGLPVHRISARLISHHPRRDHAQASLL